MQKLTYHHIIAIFTFSCLTAFPIFSQVGLEIQASHTSGIAPLYVFFDATNSTGLVETNDLVNADFNWNFDITDTDPDGDWETIKGMVAGHVFEEAGTYSVQCSVTAADGSMDMETIDITVSAFSGTTYYVSNAGDNSNDGLSDATTWQTANFAFDQLSPNERILFNRGEIFSNVDYHFHDLMGGKMIVGAYGIGDKPVLSGVTDAYRMLELDFVEDIAFIDIHVAVNAPSVGGSNFDIEDCSDVLLLDLELEGATSYAVFNDECNLTGVFDNYIHNFGVMATFAGNGTRLSWVGNSIDSLIGTPQPEHGLRIQGGEKQFIAHNDLTNLIETKSSIQIRGDGQRHVMIYKNKMDRILGINPQNAVTIAAISDVTIEGNYIGQNLNYTGTSWENSNNGINIEATNIAIRNNVIDGYRNAIFVGHDYNGVVSGMVDIHHNTVNWRPVSPQSNTAGRIVRIRDVNYVNINNNFITATDIADGVVLDSTGTNMGISEANNIVSTPDDYSVGLLPGSAAHQNDVSNYQIMISSSANNAGGSGIPVFYDVNNYIRNIATPDAGAFEYNEDLNVQFYDDIAVSIYPNPTAGIFNIQLDGIQNNLQFELYNSIGIRVLDKIVVEYHTFNISNLPKGIYYWRLMQEGLSINQGKLVSL